MPGFSKWPRINLRTGKSTGTRSLQNKPFVGSAPINIFGIPTVWVNPGIPTLH
jgi:hypothetical protein